MGGQIGNKASLPVTDNQLQLAAAQRSKLSAMNGTLNSPKAWLKKSGKFAQLN